MVLLEILLTCPKNKCILCVCKLTTHIFCHLSPTSILFTAFMIPSLLSFLSCQWCSSRGHHPLTPPGFACPCTPHKFTLYPILNTLANPPPPSPTLKKKSSVGHACNIFNYKSSGDADFLSSVPTFLLLTNVMLLVTSLVPRISSLPPTPPGHDLWHWQHRFIALKKKASTLSQAIPSMFI